MASPIWCCTDRSLVRSTPATAAAIAPNALSGYRTRDNAPANALYRGLGFETTESYHYRRAPA